MINMKQIIVDFQKAKPTPSTKLIAHLGKLEKEFSKANLVQIKTLVKKSRKLIKKFYKDMEKVRGSFYCSICNWRNHYAISPETMTLHLHHKF